MVTNIINRLGQFIVSIILLLLALLWNIGQGLAYSPPIGIPNPWIAPDVATKARPDPWTSEQAGYYYVNYQTGTDSGRAYGTPTAPRRTIPTILAAGSYVEVHGTYSKLDSGSIIINPQGTATNPVWIVGIEGDEPTFTGGKVFLYGSYCYVDNIKVVHNFQIGTPTTGYQTDYIMIRNSEVTGYSTGKIGGIHIAGSSANHISNVIVYNNYVHDIGDIFASTDVDDHSITCLQFVNHAWILDNTVHTGGGTGIALGGTTVDHTYTESSYLYVGRNHVYNVLQAGVATKYSNHVIISENHVHDIIDSSWSPSKGIGFQYRPHNTWVIFNKIHGQRYGVRGASTDSVVPLNIYIIGNQIYDITGFEPDTSTWHEAGIALQGGINRYILNNTIYNVDAGINGSSTEGNYIMENNIISNVRSSNGNHVWIEYRSSVSELKNSIIHQSGFTEKIKWGSNLYNGLLAFQTATGKGENSNNNDPLFYDTKSLDFHLQSSSPAIDSGVLHEVYTTFFKTYGLSIQKDANNISRPIGEGMDIGAYEFTDSIVPKIMNIVIP